MDLGDLGGGYARAWSINDQGEVVGDAVLPGSGFSYYQHAVTWAGSGIADLGTLGGGHSAAWDINSSGTICGWAYDSSGHVSPALWMDGAVSALPMLDGGINGFARAINDQGTAVGNVVWSSGIYHAALWEAGQVLDLGTLGGDSSVAYDINELGSVVGSAYDSQGRTRAALWGDSGLLDLGGLSGGQWTAANQINDLGETILWGKPQGGAYSRAAFWDGDLTSPVTTLGTLGGNASWAYGLNDNGVVVGAAELAVGYHAFVWDGDRMTDLGTLGGGYSVAYDVNDQGVIVGLAADASGTYHAVQWVPVADAEPMPVPDSSSSLGLLALSLFALWVCCQRGRLCPMVPQPRVCTGPPHGEPRIARQRSEQLWPAIAEATRQSQSRDNLRKVNKHMSTSFNKSLFAAVLAWCLCQSAASAAVTYDWQFQTAASPASPDVGDPAATATITAGTGGGYVNPAVGYAVSSYWYLGFSGPDYPGSDPKVALSIPGTANQSLEFTLTVRQFVESGTFNGALTYTIDGGFLQNSWTRDEETKLSDGSFGGAWYYYSTSWQVAESVNPETVVIFGSPTGTLINSIQLGVEPVPEPIAGVLGAAGVAIAAAMFHQCRRRGGNSQPASRT